MTRQMYRKTSKKKLNSNKGCTGRDSPIKRAWTCVNFPGSDYNYQTRNFSMRRTLLDTKKRTLVLREVTSSFWQGSVSA